ncbi:AMP-binding enzyme family protein [Mycobacterium kansasii]|uniref:AMP-binding enzyme family protein n=1 Tax=Mycobacterium kansasii TaxID=1768 RepID=A0A1V3WGA8_MYCKA|nr:AMP-binding enzyme family protein [Mycobacterium kansasii]
MFLDRVAATPHAEAFRYPHDHGWESVTWEQVGERVHHLAAGLISLGIAAEDRVALASSTRYEWVLTDFAVMCAGAATTTVYPTTIAPTSPTSSPIPAAGSWSPRTKSRSTSCSRTAPNCLR